MKAPRCLDVLLLVAAAAALTTSGSAAQITLARQPGTPSVQRLDHPLPGARSPRNASYDIAVTLDHAARTLHGRQTLRWRNISARPATELQFHLYWNAWRNADSTWMRERRLAGPAAAPCGDGWGGIDVTSMILRAPGEAPIDVTARMRFIAPDDGNEADRTVMTVPVPSPVGPGGTIEAVVEWNARIPRPFARTGYIDDYYFIGHWFPKLGVLEDAGWNTHQFHAVTEFYADFGVYDVAITVPRRFVVAASGRETGPPTAVNGTVTHRYRGEDIHDFAWAASPRFVESRRRIGEVDVRLLLQPEQAPQEDRHFGAVSKALALFGEWFGRYPYDHLTIVGPAYQSASSGMEYPTLFTSRTRWLMPAAVAGPDGTIVHEAAHQYWQGVVATNEFEHAWMDEGLATFADARAIEAGGFANHLELRFFGGFVPWVIREITLRRADDSRLSRFRRTAATDLPATSSFRLWEPAASAQIYDKPALWLLMLERHLGWPTLQRILSTFFERWQFRHPLPQHFFEVASEVSGQDLTWFFDRVYRSADTFDYAAQALVTERIGDGVHRSTAVAERRGEGVFPVDVVTTFADGHRVRERWDGMDRRRTFVYERPSPAVTLQVDSRRVVMLDVNYTNNSRTTEPRGDAASRTWALQWMVWLQDLMLTYAFFV